MSLSVLCDASSVWDFLDLGLLQFGVLVPLSELWLLCAVLLKLCQGKSLSRRERQLLVQTTTDLFITVPASKYCKMATVSLKLLVDNSTEKVIFAEAGKDFVDFLFGLLEIPLGSLPSLLAKERMCESWTLSKVYESVNKLGNEYLQPDQTKKSLLNPDMP